MGLQLVLLFRWRGAGRRFLRLQRLFRQQATGNRFGAAVPTFRRYSGGDKYDYVLDVPHVAESWFKKRGLR